MKMVTTLAWQLKPKTMMGMANSAPKSQRKRGGGVLGFRVL